MSATTSRPIAISKYADLDRGPRRVVLLMLTSLTAFVVFGLIWMNFASLDIAVKTLGAVIPTSRVQQVQSLEGGIIERVLVSEGQRVQQGQPLVRFQTIEFNSELGEVQQSYWGMIASIARLEAELADQVPRFPREIIDMAPQLVAKQRELWQSRRDKQQSALATIQSQIKQREQELAEAQSNVRSLEQSLAIVRERRNMEKRLFDSGAGSRADYLSATQDLSNLEGELRGSRISVTRLRAAVAEGNSSRQELVATYRAEINQELSQLRSDAASLAENISGKLDRVSRRELRAPKDGIVNRLLISTEGGVAGAGESIMEIVPEDETLLVTARVEPKDIGFIQPGQPALIRITAFDSSVFGALNGRVVRIGADAIPDEKTGPYFEVQIETDESYRDKNGEPLYISPGMTAESTINTGKRTLMQYMLKPIFKTFDAALTER